ncbi:MAG: tRNA uridine-5-carboxymethylaminomethyl(34) synthesis GTPase MnmE [Verrucomicrobiota bacterium]
MQETISALATPSGVGALAVIRISGSGALSIADKIFRGVNRPSASGERKVLLGRIVGGDEEVIDEVLLTVFRNPRSYTGEDLVEICGHGGTLVASRVLASALAAGSRMARAGEFTERAFLNGKLDLTQAEAVMDLISAQTPRAARAAALQLEGTLGSEIRILREELLQCVAHLEAYIDFPEEGIDPESGIVLRKRMEAITDHIQRLLATAGEGILLREGITLALCGAPNAGKSSLMNRLLGTERSIVNATPGTTRDTIEAGASLGGYPFRIIDTAGLRETEDPVEQEGVRRARKAAQDADLRIHLVDASTTGASVQPLFEDELLLLNKIDLIGNAVPYSPTRGLGISCKTGEGIEELVQVIIQKVTGQSESEATTHGAAISVRHRDCLERALAALREAIRLLATEQPPEILAVELRCSLAAVGEIVGDAGTEEILGKIFSSFCIGK